MRMLKSDENTYNHCVFCIGKPTFSVSSARNALNPSVKGNMELFVFLSDLSSYDIYPLTDTPRYNTHSNYGGSCILRGA